MKRSMRRILSVLLAGMLLLLPVMEAAASYDLASGIWPEELFPGESLTGIAPGTLTVDGTPVDTPEDLWTNNESGRVYAVSQDEEGNYSLDTLGYTLTVKNGFSWGEYEDEFSVSEENHRTITSEESMDGMSADTACYMAGDRVVISADEPEEGMQFAGWSVEPSDSESDIDDLSQSETMITMPDSAEGVVVTAQYAEVQPAAYMVTVNNGSGSGEYEVGAQVYVSANDRSGEGLSFADWSVESGNVVMDTAAADTSFVMPEGDVILTAQYDQVPAETSEGNPSGGEGTPGQTSGDGTQNAGGDAQNSGDGMQNAGGDAQNSGDGTQNAGGDTQNSGDGMQNAGGDAQNSGDGTQNAGGDPQNSGNGSEQGLEPGDGSGTGAGDGNVPDGNNSGQDPDGMWNDTTIWNPSEQDNSLPQEEGKYPLTVENGTGGGNYAPNERVEISAVDRSAEGLEFSGWAVTSFNVVLEDINAPETAFIMPEAPVMISAGYTAVPQPDGSETDPSQTDGSETDPPQTDGSETDPPQTDAPQTDAPQTDAPQTDAPQTEAPQTDAPQTNAPQTDAPQTNAPQTDAPQTNGYPVNIVETDAPPTEEPQTEMPQTDLPQTDESEEETFEEQVYRLTVENGRGSGEYEEGEIVAIEADEKEGMAFAGWVSYNDTVEISDPQEMVTTLVMPAEDVVVAADYVTAEYGVTLNSGTGETTRVLYSPGETVTLTAPDRKAEKLQFAYWSGTQVIAGTLVELQFADAKAATTTFTMPQGEVAVYANYMPMISTYRVTVSNGLINGTYQEMDCTEGDSITVTANASPKGQKFQMWKVNNGKVDLGKQAYSSSITVKVTQNLNFQAVYEGIEYNVTVKKGTADYKTCTQGTTVTIQAKEAPLGAAFDHWEVNSGNVSLADASKSQTTFVMPGADVEVRARYRKVQYQLAVENGTSDAQYYHMGDTVKITSNYPAGGRVFGGWTADGGDVEFADSGHWTTTFAMPASNVVVKANYTDGPSPDSNEIQNIVQGGMYFTGDAIEFTASGAGMNNTNPNPGDYRYRPASYQIGSVTGTWQGSPYSTSMAINAAGEYTLKVIYNRDIYDGSGWKPDGTVDTKSVTFKVSTGRLSVNTGDETPIGKIVAALAVSGLVFVVLLVMFLKRRRR